MKQKKRFKAVCPICNKVIIGFSEHHAKQNLSIHTKTSNRCKEIKRLLKK